MTSESVFGNDNVFDGSLLEATEAFMLLAGQLDNPGLPQDTKDPLRVLRRRMLAEANEGEVSEYLNGEFGNNPTEIADGLLDVIVVAWGTMLAYFGPELSQALAAEVARSNLDKVIPVVNKRADGKVTKPAGWRPPEIQKILARGGVWPDQYENTFQIAPKESNNE